MNPPEKMTAEEFCERRMDLPEGGRWHELHEGRPVLLQAPDDQHGNIVMNLSRSLATWFRTRLPKGTQYAVHEIGILVRQNPDTVYMPAISLFDGGPLFAQTDLQIATQVPRLIVEVASSNDRRKDLQFRTNAYLRMGVDMIWIPDPHRKEIQVLRRSLHTLVLGERQQLEGGHLLPDFQTTVRDIFAQPEWWSGSISSGTETKHSAEI
ncbi:MAG: Uma2 family endonuclease [Planctomyces sp.]